MIRRFSIVLLSLVVAVVLVAGVGLAVLAWRPGLFKQPLESFLSARLDVPVRIAGPVAVDLGRIVTIEVNDLSVAAPDWAEARHLATLERLRVGLDVGALLGGQIRLTRLMLDEPQLALERDASGRTSWPSGSAGGTAAQPQAEAGFSASSLPDIESLTIENGRIAYSDAVVDVQVAATVRTGGPAADEGPHGGLIVRGDGKVKDDALTLALETGSPLPIGRDVRPLPVSGEITLGRTRLQLDGHAAQPLSLSGIELALELASQQPRDLIALAGRRVEGDLPPLDATARFSRDRSVMALDDLDLRWGDSRIEGRGRYDPSTSRPQFAAELRAPLIDAVALQPLLAADPVSERDGGPGFLVTHDGILELKADRIRLPRTELADVTATVRLENARLTVPQLRASGSEGTLTGELAAGPLDGPVTAKLDLTADDVALGPWLEERAGVAGLVTGRLTGTAELQSRHRLLNDSRLLFDGKVEQLRAAGLAVEELAGRLRLADGRLAADPLRAELPQGRIEGHASAAFPLADLDVTLALDARNVGLGQFVRDDSPFGGIVDAHVEGTLHGDGLAEILRQSRLRLTGDATALRLPALDRPVDELHLEATLAPDAERALQLSAEGAIDGTPLRLEGEAGDLPKLAAGAGSFPVLVEVRLGETTAEIDGTVALPLAGGRIAGTFSVKGPDPGPVLALFGQPEIELPPYRLGGTLARNGSLYQISDLDGTVGDTELSGEMALRLEEPRPSLTGTLRSRLLDLDDLAGLIGAESSGQPGETASPEQQAEARADAGDGQVLPDEKLDPQRWQQLDLDLRLAAEKVQAGNVPLDAFTVGITLQAGQLRVEPLRLQLGEGHLQGHVAVDARDAPAVAEVDLELRRLPVARLLDGLGVDTTSFGTLSGHARGGLEVGGRGLSVESMLAQGDGAITLMMDGGTISRTLVTALELDLLRLLSSVLDTAPERVELRCTLADLVLKDGVLETRTLVVDTPIADIVGEGTVNLDTEQISLRLIARPESASLPSGRTGVRITGTLADPEIAFNPVTLAARGAIAATLGVLLRPFTAVADALAEDVPEGSPCADLLARSQEAQG